MSNELFFFQNFESRLKKCTFVPESRLEKRSSLKKSRLKKRNMFW